MIENPQAGRIKRAAQLARKKERLRQGRFLVEGPHATLEALNHAPGSVEQIYATQAGLTKHPEIDRRADRSGVEILQVTEPVLAALADTVTPQGVVAVAKIPHRELGDVLDGEPKLVAILHEVRDPGNAGTVIRGADAAGADVVILTGDSVDPWHPKVVRATTGSLFHLPVVSHPSLEETLTAVHGAGLTSVATSLSGVDLRADDPALARPLAWVFGNEAHGLDAAAIARCERAAKLPIFGKAESLNLATAATVCLYTTAFAQRSTPALAQRSTPGASERP